MRQGTAQKRIRLAIVVSHPIQYYTPLYRRLAQRADLEIKVFFTWHAGQAPVRDHGFMQPVAWDIPLTDGYEFELVPNVSDDPGTHRFFGLRNPSLVARVKAWSPDAVHLTGWAWWSHLLALRSLRGSGIPVLFRGDSHLLDATRSGLRWHAKRVLLGRVYSWPRAFLCVGSANREYYEALGVKSERLYACPHSIDVARFSGEAERHELEATAWRRELGISDASTVLLFAGKFESKKRPMELMRAVQAFGRPNLVLVMVGSGELEAEIKRLAQADPARFRVLPFQNQSRMPVVYRLGDVAILPSAFGETWGLAANESMACGRPVIVSDRVGCAADVVDDSCGRVFPWDDLSAMMQAVNEMTSDRSVLATLSLAAARRAWAFDIGRTDETLVQCLRGVCVG